MRHMSSSTKVELRHNLRLANEVADLLAKGQGKQNVVESFYVFHFLKSWRSFLVCRGYNALIPLFFYNVLDVSWDFYQKTLIKK